MRYFFITLFWLYTTNTLAALVTVDKPTVPFSSSGSSETIAVTNYDKEDASLNPTVTGNHPTDFTIGSPPNPSENCSTKLAGGSFCKFTVTFNPTGSGERSATINLAEGVTVTLTGQAGTVTPATFTLTLNKPGTGQGTITSDSASINCGSTCNGNFTANTTVTLTAFADPNSTFTGWSGDCSGNTICQVTMNGDKTVTAIFTANQSSSTTLTVTKYGTGQGTITSDLADINCGYTCNSNFTTNSIVMLTATADSNSTFTGWSGDDCSGNYSVCQVVMSASKNVTATFTPNQPSPTSAHLVNISTRAYTSTGLSNVIAGFIIQGTGSCTVMIRGFGKGIGLSPQLDSQLLLQAFPSGTPIISNQSWLVGNDPNQIPPILHLPDSSDAGILITLPAGAYTATMTPEGVDGIGLIGVDQVSCDTNTQLVNISTRAEVRDNLEVVIAGFIIDGPGTVRVMLRGFGAGTGFSSCLNTYLTLQTFPGAALITDNDDWVTAVNASQIPDLLKLPNYTDAGILIDLPAGAYTATMTRTASSCTGIGLIGVDVVP